MEKLSLYGFNKYSVVSYKVWEELDKFPGLSEKFLTEIIRNPTIIKKDKKNKENEKSKKVKQ